MKKQKKSASSSGYIGNPDLTLFEQVLTVFSLDKIDYNNLFDYKPLTKLSREVELTAFIAVALSDIIGSDYLHPDEFKKQVNLKMRFPDNTVDTFSSLYNDTDKKIKYSNIGYITRFILYQSGKRLQDKFAGYYENKLDLFDADCTTEKDKNVKYNGIRLNKATVKFLSSHKQLVNSVLSKILKKQAKVKASRKLA